MVHRFAKVREGNVTLCMFQFLHAALLCVVLGWDLLTCALHLAHRSLFCGNAAFERPSELKNVAPCIPASLLWLIFHQATRGSYSGLVAAAVVATVAVVVPILETTRLNGIQSRWVARSQIANVHVPHPKTKIGFTFSDLESGLVLGFSMFFHHLVLYTSSYQYLLDTLDHWYDFWSSFGIFRYLQDRVRIGLSCTYWWHSKTFTNTWLIRKETHMMMRWSNLCFETWNCQTELNNFVLLSARVASCQPSDPDRNQMTCSLFHRHFGWYMWRCCRSPKSIWLHLLHSALLQLFWAAGRAWCWILRRRDLRSKFVKFMS